MWKGWRSTVNKDIHLFISLDPSIFFILLFFYLLYRYRRSYLLSLLLSFSIHHMLICFIYWRFLVSFFFLSFFLSFSVFIFSFYFSLSLFVHLSAQCIHVFLLRSCFSFIFLFISSLVHLFVYLRQSLIWLIYLSTYLHTVSIYSCKCIDLDLTL